VEKQPTLYVAYEIIDNNDNVQHIANGKGDKITPKPGDDLSAISLKIVYIFNVSLLEQQTI